MVIDRNLLVTSCTGFPSIDYRAECNAFVYEANKQCRIYMQWIHLCVWLCAHYALPVAPMAPFEHKTCSGDVSTDEFNPFWKMWRKEQILISVPKNSVRVFDVELWIPQLEK